MLFNLAFKQAAAETAPPNSFHNRQSFTDRHDLADRIKPDGSHNRHDLSPHAASGTTVAK